MLGGDYCVAVSLGFYKSLLRCQYLGKLLQILKGILFTGHGVDDCFETGKPFCAAPDQF